MLKHRTPKHAETTDATPDGGKAPAPAAAGPAGISEMPSRMLNVLVTPKITFALPCKSLWQTVEDIDEHALREAFLARFPVKLRAEHLAFKCATPGAQLGEQPTLVYRISSSGVPDDRVLLSVLSELDHSYTAKFTEQLERARADCLASSNCFQVVADEVRSAQEAASRRWETEVRSLKDFQSKNQKRLFLLEQERDQLRDQLHRASSSSEKASAQLRAAISGLSDENASLRSELTELKEQVGVLIAAAAAYQLERVQVARHAAGVPASVDAEANNSTSSTQTDAFTEDAAGREEMAHWQQQLSAVSEWLKTGAALLQDAPGMGQPALR